MSTGDGVLDAQVQVYVQTRGSARATDYAFLGGAPAQPWWRAYRDTTAFDHPTVLVTSDGARWAAYLSGIPSARVDAVGTVVRYTLVLDGPCGAADTACVPAAVAAWLDDVAAGGGPGPLSAALDARFPSDDVQRWLVTQAPAAEVRRRTLAALASLPAPPHGAAGSAAGSATGGTAGGAAGGAAGSAAGSAAGGAAGGAAGSAAGSAAGAAGSAVGGAAGGAAGDPGDDWIGAVGAPGPRAAFAARVAALVGGGTGRALLLNLVGAPDDVGALRDPASPVAVLVESTDPRLARPTALRPVVEAKKAPAPPAASRTGSTAGTAVALLTAFVLVALVVTALLLR